MKQDDLKIISCDEEVGMWLIEVVGAEPECSFCGNEITKENFGGIFSKPTRVCCKNICCLTEAIPFEG